MQRSWQVLCDRTVAPGVRLVAGTIVEQVRGARLIHGWTAVRVVDGSHVGRVVAMRVESDSQWLNLAPLDRRMPTECSHGVAVERPWACVGCVVAAVACGLGEHGLQCPEMPGLPIRRTYFEDACHRWAMATGRVQNQVSYGRMCIERWQAHDAGVPWDEWVQRAYERMAERLAEEAWERLVEHRAEAWERLAERRAEQLRAMADAYGTEPF
jgi:hypothetical protein